MNIDRRTFLKSGALAAAAIPVGASPAQGATRPQKSEADFKLCVFSKHLQFLDFPAMAETAAAIGFDGVDLAVRPGGHVEPDRAQADLPAAVRAVNQAGLRVFMMTTAIRDAQEPHTESLLKLARDHDIGVYRMGYLSYDHRKGVAGTLRTLQASMRELTSANARHGVRGDYQNHAGARIGGPVWDIWELMREMDPAWLGCQYDIRHAVVEGGTAWPVGLRLLHDRIHSLVFKDFHWAEVDGRWRVRNCPLGQGMVDWPAYLGLIRELGIAGPISMHFEYPIHDTATHVSAAEKKEQCIIAMRKDLETARRYLAEAGLA